MSRPTSSTQLGCLERVVMIHAPEAVLSSGKTHRRSQRAEDLIDAK
jgi:hypothetical protein